MNAKILYCVVETKSCNDIDFWKSQLLFYHVKYIYALLKKTLNNNRFYQEEWIGNESLLVLPS
ncbi:hypothetical protein HZS_4274 [Henneguya salminicola]|nr:hypothetical protein HZS_4274 [Henneguya salminicola]